jgi:glutaredoxin
MKLAWLIALLLAAPAATAAVYKWKDEEGHLHFSDRPVPGAEAAELKPITFTGMPVIGEIADAQAATSHLRMYGTKWCGVCRKARAWLASHHIAYDDIDVEASTQAEQDFVRAGGTAYPFFVAGRQTMLGFSENKIHQLIGGR